MVRVTPKPYSAPRIVGTCVAWTPGTQIDPDKAITPVRALLALELYEDQEFEIRFGPRPTTQGRTA